jgi:hypothetical protein
VLRPWSMVGNRAEWGLWFDGSTRKAFTLRTTGRIVAPGTYAWEPAVQSVTAHGRRLGPRSHDHHPRTMRAQTGVFFPRVGLVRRIRPHARGRGTGRGLAAPARGRTASASSPRRLREPRDAPDRLVRPHGLSSGHRSTPSSRVWAVVAEALFYWAAFRSAGPRRAIIVSFAANAVLRRPVVGAIRPGCSDEQAHRSSRIQRPLGRHPPRRRLPGSSGTRRPRPQRHFADVGRTVGTPAATAVSTVHHGPAAATGLLPPRPSGRHDARPDRVVGPRRVAADNGMTGPSWRSGTAEPSRSPGDSAVARWDPSTGWTKGRA